jgi:dihydrofolate synthase/folylpolyglutamate synthase
MMGDDVTGLERSYREDMEWLFTVRRFGSKLGLDYVSHLLSRIGDPQDDFRSIHVTGTSGKGSTTAMVASILSEAGYKVGMFTSPHLMSFMERIVVDGRKISAEDVVRLVSLIRPVAEEMAADPQLRHPTFFEIVTAMAFEYFAEEDVEFAVLEAGMGGRLDATNVVKALVSVITNVGLEHTEVLGDTLLEIAEKKAGIIKKGGALITATADDEVFHLFTEICRRVGSRIFRVGDDLSFEKIQSDHDGQRFRLEGLFDTYGELFIPLLGEHQLLNAASAVGAVEALRFYGVEVPRDAVEGGLASVRWPGRMEIVQTRPLVVLDGAKDVDATRAVKETLLNDFDVDRVVAVVSMSSDKKIAGMIEQLAQAADYFVITAHGVMGRAAEPSLIARELERLSKGHEIVEDIKDAVRRAIHLAGEDGMVIVVGSIFLVGEARELWYELSDPFAA